VTGVRWEGGRGGGCSCTQPSLCTSLSYKDTSPYCTQPSPMHTPSPYCTPLFILPPFPPFFFLPFSNPSFLLSLHHFFSFLRPRTIFKLGIESKERCAGDTSLFVNVDGEAVLV
jgi:hypothetical protein